MRRGLIVVVLLLTLTGVAPAAVGVDVPQWVSDRQAAYTVRCDRQLASSLANVDWDRQLHSDAERYIATHPGSSVTYGDQAWHRYWERVDDQLHRQLLTLCGR